MKFNTYPLALSALLFTAVSCNDASKNETDSKEAAQEQNEQKFDDTNLEDDAKFVVKAADGGLLEVQLGKLAATNASSNAVKEFAKSMVDDHSKANEELKALAAKKNITIPEVLSDDSQKEYNKLAEKTGKDFDEAYSDFMVKDHKKDIDAFKKEADKGKDPEIKGWASDKVPVLEHHLHMAESNEELTDKNK